MRRREFVKGTALTGVGLSTFYISDNLIPGFSVQSETVFPSRKANNQMLFASPANNQIVHMSPPGLSWYPAQGVFEYEVEIKDQGGLVVYRGVTKNPVHLPDVILKPGIYTWQINGLDQSGRVTGRRGIQTFTIASENLNLPWVSPKKLLSHVPKEHSRVQYLRADLPAIRKKLSGNFKATWEELIRKADLQLNVDPPVYPTYQYVEDRVQSEMEYHQYYKYFRKKIDGSLYLLSLAYLLSDQRKYADSAKKILLEIADWPTNQSDVSSVSAKWGDEVGLSLSRYAHRSYDWLYPALSSSEREIILKMCEGRAWQTYHRLKRNDHLSYPGSSHDTRLICYLGEMAVSMAHESKGAETWLDYSLQALTTTFPHWGGANGGWAQGVAYGVWYNDFYIPSLDTIKAATGFDIWKKPFFSKLRYFYLYCTSPLSEYGPFGDAAERGGPQCDRIQKDYISLLSYHAERFEDPHIKWYLDQVNPKRGVKNINSIAFDFNIEPKAPVDLPNSRVFKGIGWAALHSDLSKPVDDTFMLFKSSPYGSVSHSHGDQNAFSIMKGGVPLAIPSGYFGPKYDMPHHHQWTRSTKANNSVLVNGKGQKLKDHEATGSIVHFEDGKEYSYVMGDATPAYKGALTCFKRHILFLRPGVFVMIDDLKAPQNARFQWMLHALNKMSVSENNVATQNGHVRLNTWLYSRDKMNLSTTDQFDTPFNTGIPESFHREKPNQWHLTAETQKKSKENSIISIIVVDDLRDQISVNIEKNQGWVRVEAGGSFGKVIGWARLNASALLPKGFISNQAEKVLFCAYGAAGTKIIL